jgi:protein-L-isoaspartate O-methyltransferase
LAYLPLPGGLDDPRAAARVTFDRQAAAYDRARPGYPPEAIGDLAARCKLGPDSRVLEVGCGTGQATGELARLGCSIRCLEPGPHLAELARRKLAANPRVQVATSTFEAADEPGPYDAVVSATAFHWIDPALSFSKAASLLPPSRVARAVDQPARGGRDTGADCR